MGGCRCWVKGGMTGREDARGLKSGRCADVLVQKSDGRAHDGPG